MLNPYSSARQLLILGLLLVCQLSPAWFLVRRPTRHSFQAKGLKSEILKQLASLWQRIGRSIGNPLIVDTALIRIAEKQDGQHRINQQQVLERMILLLAAIAAFLFSSIFGTRDAALGSIMAKRGMAMSVGVSVSSANRFFNSASERLGASPSVRKVFLSTSNNT